jgi:hypothetical protein
MAELNEEEEEEGGQSEADTEDVRAIEIDICAGYQNEN